jgi:hypothetical protein
MNGILFPAFLFLYWRSRCHDYLALAREYTTGKRKWPLFKKSGQKLLLAWARGSETSTAQTNKVFLLLFVHKK